MIGGLSLQAAPQDALLPLAPDKRFAFAVEKVARSAG
jgi:hypothetical protein